MSADASTDATRPAANPALDGITPYVQGKAALADGRESIKLSSNESAFGPSPRAVQAFQAMAGSLHRYPDGSQRALREAIAEVYSLDAERIVCGNGSAELISLLTHAYTGPGDELVLSENHFEMCPIYGRSAGASVVFAAEAEDRISVEQLLDQVGPSTRMVNIANPNNPTGTYLPVREVERLQAGLSKDVLLIVDGAYAEFVTSEASDQVFKLVEDHDNVVITRSFSKMYGLAGLRLGWAYCPARVATVLNTVRTPFNANAAAMAAGAAAIGDREFVERVRVHNTKWLQRISDTLQDLGLRVLPSQANFYLIHFDACAGKDARSAAEFLESRGIIPRPVAKRDRANALRITVGLDHENEAVLQALSDYMQG